MIKTILSDIYGNEIMRTQAHGTRFYVDDQGTLLIMDAEDHVLDAFASGIWKETHLEIQR